MDTNISARIEQASKITGLSEQKIRSMFVSSESINDDNLINTVISLSSHSEIISSIEHFTGIGILSTVMLTSAASILRGSAQPITDPVKAEDKIQKTSVIEDIMRSQRPLQQWSDEELLEVYIDKEQEECEFELQKRARGRRFVVLSDRENEIIDIVATLRMLKRARKEDIPSYYMTPEGDIIHIYRIEDYHQNNRIRSESPLRPGVALFDDFCPVSNISFSGIDMNTRRFIRLIHDSEGALSRRDEKYIVELARKDGIAGLIKEYPELNLVFTRKTMDDTLPTLKLIENVASTYVTKSDPFKPSRHKQF